MTPAEAVSLAARASLAAAAGVAVAVSRPHPGHRPVAQALVVACVLDLARWATRGTPAADVLLLAFPAVSASVPGRVLAGFPSWPLAAVWLVLAGATLTGAGGALTASPERLYGAVQAAGVALQAYWVVEWAVRLKTESDRSDSVSQTAALLLFAGDVASFFGPFATGQPRRDWYVAQAQTVVLFLVLNAWQVRHLRRGRELERSAGPGDV